MNNTITPAKAIAPRMEGPDSMKNAITQIATAIDRSPPAKIRNGRMQTLSNASATDVPAIQNPQGGRSSVRK